MSDKLTSTSSPGARKDISSRSIGGKLSLAMLLSGVFAIESPLRLPNNDAGASMPVSAAATIGVDSPRPESSPLPESESHRASSEAQRLSRDGVDATDGLPRSVGGADRGRSRGGVGAKKAPRAEVERHANGHAKIAAAAANRILPHPTPPAHGKRVFCLLPAAIGASGDPAGSYRRDCRSRVEVRLRFGPSDLYVMMMSHTIDLMRVSATSRDVSGKREKRRKGKRPQVHLSTITDRRSLIYLLLVILADFGGTKAPFW